MKNDDKLRKTVESKCNGSREEEEEGYNSDKCYNLLSKTLSREEREQQNRNEGSDMEKADEARRGNKDNLEDKIEESAYEINGSTFTLTRLIPHSTRYEQDAYSYASTIYKRDAYSYASTRYEQDAYSYASTRYEQDAYSYASTIYKRDVYLCAYIYMNENSTIEEERYIRGPVKKSLLTLTVDIV